MNKWKFEELLSDETKANILKETMGYLKDEMDEEEVKNYINVELGNSYWEMIKAIIDVNELELV